MTGLLESTVPGNESTGAGIIDARGTGAAANGVAKSKPTAAIATALQRKFIKLFCARGWQVAW